MHRLSSKSIMIIVIGTILLFTYISCNILKGTKNLEQKIDKRYEVINELYR